MQMLSKKPVINTTLIPLLLQWWQHRKRLANTSRTPVVSDTDDNHYLDAYHRMMEVYSVVKAGGVDTQIAAAQAYLQRETQSLQQQLAVLQAEKDNANLHQKQAQLNHEAQELESSVNWRLHSLKEIKPEEEAAVRQHMAEIERILLHR